MSRSISISVKRRLYAESMGRCMNPNCKVQLFKKSGDIIEKAHIVAHHLTQENSYENLIVLCPNCHTEFDKNSEFTEDDVREWKKIRREELERFFSTKYESFEALKSVVQPILLENHEIYKNYFTDDQKELWDIFEIDILVNNCKLKTILSENLNLIQNHEEEGYSNLAIVNKFLLHIEEFERTRLNKEKTRHVLFPDEINSLFGIKPIEDSFMPSVESLEALISKLLNKGVFESIVLGEDKPYIQLKLHNESTQIYLNDIPRLRQLYFDNNCFRKTKVRFESLNFAFKIIRSRHLDFEFIDQKNLREIKIKNRKIVFIYEYCLSKVSLQQLLPEENSIIVNLHNWNGKECISSEAYEFAKEAKVTLLRTEELYAHIR